MSLTTDRVASHELTLPQELVLMLLNEETGYFRQVPGWDLNCALIGAILAELSLRSRIDTDSDSLKVLDRTRTDNPVLDPILEKLAEEPTEHNVQYWIERLVFRASSIIDLILERLVDLKILDYHDGEFWSLARTAWQTEVYADSDEDTAVEFVKTRVSRAIFDNEIPGPRDVIIIGLLNTCDVLRFTFQLDDESEERIRLICRMNLIGRSVSEAVSNNLAAHLLQRSAFTKPIPAVPLHRLLANEHIRDGNLPALFADLAAEHGPVFQIRPPFAKPLTFLAGPRINQWVRKHGRMYLRSKDYLEGFEKVFGTSGILPALDGADHFRLRKASQPGHSRERLEGQIDRLYELARSHMANWKVGDTLPAGNMCLKLINAQISPLLISVESQDLIDDLIAYKQRALTTGVLKVLPKFMMRTPGMKRRSKSIEELLERIHSVHTPAQRAGCPRDLPDDMLSLYESDPQFFPEANLRFHLAAPLITSMYVSDALSFALYSIISHPELYDKIQGEAEALFANGDPGPKDFTTDSIDVTHRVLMEIMRLYPTIPMSVRHVMNSFAVEGFAIPEGSRIYIAQTASHYMEKVFPDPFSFDIDRYQSPRNEHRSSGYAPYGLGTHTCLGFRWVELQLTVNLLMLAHYFTLEMSPANSKLKINPIPTLSLSKKLKFVIAEQRREIPA